MDKSEIFVVLFFVFCFSHLFLRCEKKSKDFMINFIQVFRYASFLFVRKKICGSEKNRFFYLLSHSPLLKIEEKIVLAAFKPFHREYVWPIGYP